MKEVKIKLGEAVYTVQLWKSKKQYGYEIIRNGKIISSTTTPLSLKADIKMAISERIMQQAFYEVNHEIEKLKL